MALRKNKKKRITKNIQMSLADPSDAAMMASSYAGLGSVGSINEMINNSLKKIYEETSIDIDSSVLEELIKKINRRRR